MLLNRVISLGLMLSLTSCVNSTVIHPISGSDIYDGKNAGDVCFSKMYLDEVIKLKIEKSR